MPDAYRGKQIEFGRGYRHPMLIPSLSLFNEIHHNERRSSSSHQALWEQQVPLGIFSKLLRLFTDAYSGLT